MTEDNKRVIKDCSIELYGIHKWIKNNPLDSNVKYLVSYAIVKSSGVIEAVFKSILHEYLTENVKAETKTYLEKVIIESSYNPSVGIISKHLGQANSDKKEKFDIIFKDTQEKCDLNSLVSLRNSTAHGRGVTVTISIIRRYFKSGVKILKSMEEVLYENFKE